MTGVPKDRLINDLDGLFSRLLEEAYPVISEEEAPQDGPKVGFVDKLRLFDSGVKWVATKNKVDPEQETDAFGLAREQLTGRSRGRGASGAPPRANGSGH
jgi:hypothetical protein